MPAVSNWFAFARVVTAAIALCGWVGGWVGGLWAHLPPAESLERIPVRVVLADGEGAEQRLAVGARVREALESGSSWGDLPGGPGLGIVLGDGDAVLASATYTVGVDGVVRVPRRVHGAVLLGELEVAGRHWRGQLRLPDDVHWLRHPLSSADELVLFPVTPRHVQVQGVAGRPIEGCGVRWREQPPSEAWFQRAVSDSAGRVMLWGAADADLTGVVVESVWIPARAMVLPEAQGNSAAPAVLVLEDLGSVELRVVPGDEASPSLGHVEVYRDGWNGGAHSIAVEAQRHHIAHVALGAQFEVVTFTGTTIPFAGPTRPGEHVVVEIPTGALQTGTLVGPDGEPLRGGFLEVFSADESGALYQHARGPASNGTGPWFPAGHVWEDAVEVEAHHVGPDGARFAWKGTAAELRGGAGHLAFAPAVALVAGRIHTGEDTPVPGACVVLVPRETEFVNPSTFENALPHAWSDERGAFAIHGPWPTDRADAVVYAPGYRSARIAVDGLAAREVSVALEPEWTVRGHVRIPEFASADSFVVRPSLHGAFHAGVHPSYGYGVPLGYLELRDVPGAASADGKLIAFEVRHLAPGPWRFSLFERGFGRELATVDVIDPDAGSVDLGLIDLCSPDAWLTVDIALPQDAAPTRVRVEFTDGGTGYATLGLNVPGRVQVPAHMEGARVSVTAPGYHTLSVETLRDGERVALTPLAEYEVLLPEHPADATLGLASFRVLPRNQVHELGLYRGSDGRLLARLAPGGRRTVFCAPPGTPYPHNGEIEGVHYPPSLEAQLDLDRPVSPGVLRLEVDPERWTAWLRELQSTR